MREMLPLQYDLSQRIEREDEYLVVKGGYADVWRGMLSADQTRPRSLAVALKIVKMCDDKVMGRLKREMVVWGRLRHTNIIPFLGFSTKYPETLCLVSPWMPNGHVSDYLNNHYTNDSAGHEKVIGLIEGIVTGLRYLHTRHLVHGDLKPTNVLVAEDGSPRLADFGFSQIRGHTRCLELEVPREDMVTWIAPERVHPEAFGLTPETAVAPASDVYSLGMTIYEILSGLRPFQGLDSVAVIYNITVKNIRPPSAVWRTNEDQSLIIEGIMQRCWTKIPTERPTAAAVLQTLRHEEGSSIPEYENSCLMCQILRRYDCDLKTPACQHCRQEGRLCDWDGSQESIAVAWPQFPYYNCTGLLSPSDPRGGEFIGTGSLGEVYRASLHGRAEVVTVTVPKRMNGTALRQLALCVREAMTWANLRQPNCLPLHGVSSIREDLLCLVSPWMENGDIMRYLSLNPNADRLRLIRGIGKAVQYLHGAHIAHGDLKGANVLVSSDGEALLADFGLSIVVEDLALVPGSHTPATRTANYRWAAPERLRPDLFGLTLKASLTTASDVFSMCRTFLEIFTGERPFSGIMEAEVVDVVVYGLPYQHPLHTAVQRGLTRRLWNLLQSGWDRRRERRPSAAEVAKQLEETPVLGTYKRAV